MPSGPFSHSLRSWWACPSGCPWSSPPLVKCPRLDPSDSPKNTRLVTQELKAEAAESIRRQSRKRGYSEFSSFLAPIFPQPDSSLLPVVLTEPVVHFSSNLSPFLVQVSLSFIFCCLQTLHHHHHKSQNHLTGFKLCIAPLDCCLSLLACHFGCIPGSRCSGHSPCSTVWNPVLPHIQDQPRALGPQHTLRMLDFFHPGEKDQAWCSEFLGDFSNLNSCQISAAHLPVF